MKPAIAAHLIALNNEFYQTFASHFSATRMRLQPGVMKILDDISKDEKILDLGCGNGELSRELIRREFQGEYIGLDFSQGLLAVAREGVASHKNYTFVPGDLGDPNWHSQFVNQQSPITLITAFAALHHIPSRNLHTQIFENIHNLLSPEGQLIHSNWQFLNSQRLRARLQPWSEIGLTEDDIDLGDYLLDWRQGGRGLRYVHHFSESELEQLAAETGFTVVDSFYSDGDGGNLGLYQIWHPHS